MDVLPLFLLWLCVILVGEGDYMVVKTLIGKGHMIFHVTSCSCWPLLRCTCVSLVFSRRSVLAAAYRMSHLYFIGFPGALDLNIMSQVLLVKKRLFFCFCNICPDIPYSALYSGTSSFGKVLHGKTGEGHLCPQTP